MKYEFRIGDYAETKDGNRGYVIKSDLLCYQDIVTGYIITVEFSNEESLTYAFTADEAKQKFKRIGKYDFTDCNVGDIEPLLIEKPVSMYCGDGKTNSPSDYRRVARQDEFNDKVMKKINEIVEAVNELRMRDAKESKDD